MMIRGIISSVTDGANRLAKFVGGKTNWGTRPFVQQYGFWSRPQDGAAGVLLRLGDSMVIIASDDSRYTVSLGDGEMAIGIDDDHKVHVKNDGTIIIKTSWKIQVQAPDVECGNGTTQALLTEDYKTSIEPYLTALQTLIMAIEALTPDPSGTLATALGVFNGLYPSGFVAPEKGKTSQTKAA